MLPEDEAFELGSVFGKNSRRRTLLKGSPMRLTVWWVIYKAFKTPMRFLDSLIGFKRAS